MRGSTRKYIVCQQYAPREMSDLISIQHKEIGHKAY